MARAARPAGAPATETVAVRMYRGILGDCFLLTHEYGGKRFRALIDCGVLQCIGKAGSKPETKAGTERIRDVVLDLKAETGGELDLVIATHEHYDHLSGFILAHDLFKEFRIGALWTAWTEDRQDTLANDIRAKRSKGLQALAALVQPGSRGEPSALVPALAFADRAKAEEAREQLADRLATISDLLQFYDEVEPWEGEGLRMAAAPRPPYDPEDKPRSCENVLQWLAHRAGEENVKALEPGMQVRFGVQNRLTANVLGPPRLRKYLLQMDPSEGADKEVYLTGRDEVASLTSTLNLQGHAIGATAGAGYPAEELPFAKRFWRPDGPTADSIRKLYYDEEQEERRIDAEWVATAETLALKIDGDVNNTSLALAIELMGGEVLLFPADAQVGNWKSWHEQLYPSEPATPGAPQKTARELLQRTILYKVGHHGSHNATLRTEGLELMRSAELVAMIPVVEDVAEEQKTRHNPDGWAMPYDKLYARLKEKTRGRIVRGDGDQTAEQAAFAGSRFTPFYDEAHAEPLWVELRCACR